MCLSQALKSFSLVFVDEAHNGTERATLQNCSGTSRQQNGSHAFNAIALSRAACAASITEAPAFVAKGAPLVPGLR
jgi:hypothetical protein